MGRASRKSQDELVEQLGSMSVNRFLNTVMEASEKRGVKLDRFVADAVAKDIQAHLTANGFQPTCPKCHSTRVVKNGKRGEIQRYRCKDCGTWLTALTGTILEKTNYTWDVWVEVVHGMLNGVGIEKARDPIARARNKDGRASDPSGTIQSIRGTTERRSVDHHTSSNIGHFRPTTIKQPALQLNDGTATTWRPNTRHAQKYMRSRRLSRMPTCDITT